jgi:Predicted UDP-glucose 6-dehydrogenase
MRISIIGYGFVGKALSNALKGDFELQKIDPNLGTSTLDIKDFKPNIIFICVPTPMNKDGSQDISILMDIINEIKSFDFQSLIVLKSTILPLHIESIQNRLTNFVYNPEFLREKHADEDFINSDMIIFGGKKETNLELSNFYKNYLKCKNKDHTFTDPVSASFIKYIINSFLATKVIFFNEFHKLFKSSSAKEDWETFIKVISKDHRIGSSHMNVPGHDGRKGFGGACLPKDANAIVKYSESHGIDLAVLSSVIRINNKIRAKYNENTERENEQNIFFEE